MIITAPGIARSWCQSNTGERRRHNEAEQNQSKKQIDREWFALCACSTNMNMLTDIHNSGLYINLRGINLALKCRLFKD